MMFPQISSYVFEPGIKGIPEAVSENIKRQHQQEHSSYCRGEFPPPAGMNIHSCSVNHGSPTGRTHVNAQAKVAQRHLGGYCSDHAKRKADYAQIDRKSVV